MGLGLGLMVGVRVGVKVRVAPSARSCLPSVQNSSHTIWPLRSRSASLKAASLSVSLG